MIWNPIFEIAKDFGLPSIILLVGFLIFRLYYKYTTDIEKTRTLKNDEVRLLAEILSNEKNANHTFLIKQLMETKYGRPFSWREISYLKKLASPSEALSLYSDSGLCINFPFDSDKPEYKGRFKIKKYRSFIKIWNVSCYFSLCLLALLLFLMTPWIFSNIDPETGYMYLAIELAFAVSAVFCLKGYVEVLRAERLMDLIAYTETLAIQSRNKCYY